MPDGRRQGDDEKAPLPATENNKVGDPQQERKPGDEVPDFDRSATDPGATNHRGP